MSKYFLALKTKTKKLSRRKDKVERKIVGIFRTSTLFQYKCMAEKMEEEEKILWSPENLNHDDGKIGG
jgi:hypothetical protein